jgi:hypothetical protein
VAGIQTNRQPTFTQNQEILWDACVFFSCFDEALNFQPRITRIHANALMNKTEALIGG